MDFIKKLKLKEPEYDSSYEEFIKKFTVEQGGKAGKVDDNIGTVAWEQGRFFSSKYEIYMYALLIGLKKGIKHPTPKGIESKKFISIESWKPVEIADYCIMCILAVSDIDLNDIEQMEDSEVEKQITKLKNLFEEYANGGFDYLKSEYENNQIVFENNENIFIDLLE